MLTVQIHGDLTAGHDNNAGSSQLVVVARGRTDEISYAADLLKCMTPHFTPLGDANGSLTCPLSWPAVVQLAFMFGDNWYPSPALTAWVQAEAQVRMLPPELSYSAPEGLTPYAHQIAGARMIKATGKVLLTDDPGTGKTVTALLGLQEWYGKAWPILVVCPASVVDHWVQAVRTWTPYWKAVAYRGPKRQNLLGSADVYVTSYDVASRDAPTGRKGPLSKLAPQAVVIDECHYIKTPGTKRSAAVRRIARDAPVVIPMSGTPITHNFGDLTPTLEAMDAGAWPSADRAKERFMITVPGDYDSKAVGLNPAAEPELRACLEGQMRRVNKADVLDLPPKVYSTRTVELPPVWRAAYDQFEEDMYAELPDDGGELAVMHAFTVMGLLKQMACAPADVRISYTQEIDKDPNSPTFGEEITKRHVHLDLKAPSWKVDALLEVLEERPQQQVIVFAPSKQLITLAGEAAAKAGRRVGYIVGGQTPKQRTAVVDGFQAGQYDVVCATTGAGGVGITLTAAQTEVFLQRPLSLVEALQAEDRAHRIGQNNSVEIIDIIARDTIDTRIRDILRDHAGQLSELVRDPRIRAELFGGHGGSKQQSTQKGQAA
jgi:SNF2 family DNA or RNA helicase